VFQTLQGSLHRFSFHEPGDPAAEPTNGHALVLGKSGGGKTTTVAFLAAQAQRAGGRTIIFDKESGLKMAVHALGGRYAEVRAGWPTGLNPLATEAGERGEAWLLDWLVALLESRSGPMTPLQSEAIKSAITQNGKAREGLRNFRAFQELFGDVGDGLDLAQRISEWGPDGRYGWVFGEAKEPVVDFTSHDVTAVDLTEILDLGTERTAILGYLFRRIELLIEEKRPTLIVIDEAWKVLDDEYFAKKLAEWLVTARKKNVVVVMMTQFPSQIRGSKARSILEALPNQLLFPNGEAETCRL
jgi:type IV secretion system protein VirB4